MNLEYIPTLAISWPWLGFWLCVFSFLFGLWIAWLLWRHTDREVRYLELENRKAQKDYEKREKAFELNQEAIESILDPNSES